MKPLHSPNGEPVQALFGFCQKLLTLRGTFPGYRMLAAFDEHSAHRSALLPSYKQQRKAMPDDLKKQVVLMREAAAAFGVPAISAPGFEADDVIASAVAAAARDGTRVVTILTSDKDMLQLISSPGDGLAVSIFDDKKKLTIDEAMVFEKHQVRPEQIVDYLALMGDAADNVPGIPGVGPKTASKLLLEYGTLNAVLEAAPNMKKSQRRANLIEFGDRALLARNVVLLRTDVPLPVDDLQGTLPPPAGTDVAAALPHLRPFLQRHGLSQLERRATTLGLLGSTTPRKLATVPSLRQLSRPAAARDDGIPF